jgi:acyl homoserine lactone synthase
MRIKRHTDDELSLDARSAIARYRYQVFVESLGWKLPCATGFEQDEFDSEDATHLVAQTHEDQIVGYARLLPTTGPYLLGVHFAHLLGDATPPSSPAIWELSRFATNDATSSEAKDRVGKKLLLEAIRCATERGCQQLVFCTTVGIERLARRWGTDIHRLGPPQRFGGDLLVAASIICNDMTRAALTEPALRIPRHRGQHSAVMAD